MAIKYCDSYLVELRLKGKVRITDDPEEDLDLMAREVFEALIEEAESQVEMDLSPRYKAPFQDTAGAEFAALPDATRLYLKALCELKAVINILTTDFGSGGAANGDRYMKTQTDRYDEMVKKTMELRSGSFNMFKYPPLPGLMLNDHNHAADDGYAGQVLSTSLGDGGFPADQINDPSETFYGSRYVE